VPPLRGSISYHPRTRGFRPGLAVFRPAGWELQDREAFVIAKSLAFLRRQTFIIQVSAYQRLAALLLYAQVAQECAR
jgi:hypothetical protein